MAGFGDSNDIKISVTVDTEPAINAAKEISQAFADIAKDIGVDFKTIAQAAKQFSAVKVEQVKKDAAEEVAKIRSTSAERIATINKDAAAFKEGEVTKRNQIQVTADLDIQKLRTVSTAFKQSQVTKRTEMQAAHKEELQKLRDAAAATAQAEATKRTEIKNTYAEVIARLRNEAKEARQTSAEKIAAIKASTDLSKAEISKEVRLVKDAEATKRAEIKKTIEEIRLESAKVRQATVALQSEGAGKAGAAGGGLGGGLPNLAAGVYLAKEAIGVIQSLTASVFQLAEAGNRVQALSTAFQTLQQSVGRDPVASIERLRTATQGLVSDTELYQKANQAVLLGVPTKLFEESAEAAVKLGRAMGIDATLALESLSIGLGRQSRLYLDNLGIVVSATEAYANFARENNKLVDDLTDAEKRLAFFNETSKKLKEGLGSLPPISRDVGIAFTELKATKDNLATAFLTGFNNSVQLEKGFTKLNEAAKPLQDVFKRAGDALGSFLGSIVTAEYIPVIDELAGLIRGLGKAAAGTADDILNLSTAAKNEQLTELADKIAKTRAQIATASPITRGQYDTQLQIYEDQLKQVQASLDEASKRDKERASFEVKAKVDTTEVKNAITETETALAQLKTKTEESLGLIRIPGLDSTALDSIIPKVDAVYRSIEAGGVKAQDAAVKVSELANAVATDIQAANIEITKSSIEREKAAASAFDSNTQLTAQQKAEAEARAVTIANLEAQLKLQEESIGLDQKQREQLTKFLDYRKGVIKKDFDEQSKFAKKNATEAANILDKQRKEIDSFVKSVQKRTKTAIPASFERQLSELFKDAEVGSREFEEGLRAIGQAAQAVGVDLTAFNRLIKAQQDLLGQGVPKEKLPLSADAAEAAAAYNDELAKAQEGIINIRDAILGAPEVGADGKKGGGAFFGFDIGGEATPQAEAQAAGAFQDFFSSALQTGLDGFGREDVPGLTAQLGGSLGSALGAYIGGPVGAQIGQALGTMLGEKVGGALAGLGKDLQGTVERKQIDKYFTDIFDSNRIGVLIQGQIYTAVSNGVVTIGQTLEEVKPQIQRISDIVFEGFTPFAGMVKFGGENFFNYFNTLGASVQNTFTGVGTALGLLQGVSAETAKLIGTALANNIGGSLQNLQVLVQATGESLETLSEAVVKAFLDSSISIEEAYNSLLQLQGIFEKGIPGAVGAWKEALNNFGTAIKENLSGRYLIDSFRDIASEGIEAGETFQRIGTEIAGSLGLSSDEIQLFFVAMRNAGITNLSQLEGASTETLISILAIAKKIKDGIALTAEDVAKIPIIPVAKAPKTGGGSRRNEAEELLKKQREEARKLAQESQQYLKIIEQINAGQLSNVAAGKEIKAINADLLALIKKRDSAEKELNAELDKGAKGNANLFAELSKSLADLEKKLDAVKEKAKENERQYKQLDIAGIIPLIKSQNSLGLIAQQIGVSLQKNVDILIKGFLQGRLSIAEVNAEIKKTKELLGPGIPNAVGAVTEAFQNLIDAGTTGGKFSTDAFVDIFAEFREKFVKEGSAFREAQRKLLNDNLDAARKAQLMAVGPEATEAATKALRVAQKAIEDFRNAPIAPDLSDLRDQLKNTFSPEQVDLFFQALDESGLKSFEEFAGASEEAIVGILGRLSELGFKFNKTSEEASGINKGLQDAEIAANAGLDPLKAAIDLVKSFNDSAGLLPPVFNSTTEAIGNMEGPLTKVKDKIADTIELLGLLDKNTFENDIVFNIRTTGEQGGRALVELIFGDGSQTSADTGNGKVTPGPVSGGGRMGKRSDWIWQSPGIYRNIKTNDIIKSKKNPGA